MFLCALAGLWLFAMSTKAQFDKSAAPYCTPTRLGVCNLAIKWPASTNNVPAVWAYDNYCREIGNNTRVVYRDQGILVPSLPETLSIDVGLAEDTEVVIDGFYYAGIFHT